MAFRRPTGDDDQEKNVDASDEGRISDDDLRWSGISIDASEQVDVSTPESRHAAATLDQGQDVDAPASDLTDGLVAPFRGDQADARVLATRRALDDALDAWWSEGVIPAPMVLRDGLLLLNAGYEMDEAQRALLLRAALQYRRGLVTALAHQVDAERTALILHDAIVDRVHPFPLPELNRLISEDPTFELWEPYLHEELLSTARSYDPGRRHYAELGIAVLDREQWPLEEAGGDNTDQIERDSLDAIEAVGRRPRWPLLVALFLGMTVVAVALYMWRYDQVRTADMVEVPGGVYALSDGDGFVRTVTVATFLIDAMEITNAEYRRCVKAGACLPPAAEQSANRTNYFDDPVFDDYPVVFVDHAAAQRYCAWTGKRLPTLNEWQLAASLAPATQRTYAFPWGDRYVAGAANDANAGHGDTLAVGDYRPSGDSPLGVSDMAGNVAEWTATLPPGEVNEFWVKGGSFADSADRARTDDAVSLSSTVAADWLGFRCATISFWDALPLRFQQVTPSSAAD